MPESILASGYQSLNCGLTASELCAFRKRWGLSDATTLKALELGQWYLDTFKSNLWIISGHRSPQEQQELLERYEQGDPSISVRPAPPDRSRHSSVYPATAFDVGYDLDPAQETERAVGTYATAQLGLVWGGVFSPVDPRHFEWHGGG